ncbi:MAG: PstS family phosphate ABC transporter substrate-binding protein [Thermoleophilia bacterium]|nr:PstS family phosphate ABC transporter substrate-binding protein [Thermoleophilia bacterium]
MRTGTWRTVAITVIASASLIAAGCGSDDSSGGSGLSGSVSADGSSTVFPIQQAIAEEFRGEHGKVEVSVGTSGTGGGFKKFCAGETDISDASRPIEDDERAACKDAGIEFVELPIATDGLSVVVNPGNDFVDCLTMDQLAKIWGPDSKVDNWKDVDPSFPDRQLALYGPGTDSGTFDYFTGEVNGEEGASRSDYTASEDDNVLVQGIAGDEGALGYFGYGYVVENADKVKAVGVDSGNGCVEPTKETIEGGTYTPLSRPLFIYVSRDGAAKEQVAAYVDFALANVNDLVGDVGFIAQPAEQLDASMKAWEAFRDDASRNADTAADADTGDDA